MSDALPRWRTNESFQMICIPNCDSRGEALLAALARFDVDVSAWCVKRGEARTSENKLEDTVATQQEKKEIGGQTTTTGVLFR